MYIPKSPLILCLELTSKCNLNCPHCLADADSNGRSLPNDKVISLVDEAQRIGVKELVLGGGEALLYENFFKLCENALSKGLNLSFATNGLLIPEVMSSLLNLQKYNESLRIGVSLDGHTPEIHGHFRPAETFETAVEAIKMLHNANFNVHILCVLNRINIKTIPQYLDFISTLNISDIRFIPFMPVGRGIQFKDEMISPEEFYEVIKSKKDIYKKYKINLGLHMPWEFLFDPIEKRHPYPCEAGYLRLWIDSKGEISPCAYMPDMSLGNIYKNSISDIWQNSPILKELRDSSLLKGICSTCTYRDGCRGGCRGLAKFLEGDFLCADPYCPTVSQKQLG